MSGPIETMPFGLFFVTPCVRKNYIRTYLDQHNHRTHGKMHTNLVACFNMEPVGGVSKAGGLVEVTQVTPQAGVLHYTLLIALENSHTHSILTEVFTVV